MFIFLMIINSMVSVIMLGFGILWKNHPPKNINWIYGYRTSMSMKNNETWKFAHMHNAKVWRWSGATWLMISMIFMVLFKDDYEIVSTWINLGGVIIILLSLIPTEIALRKRFDKNGNLR